MHGLAQTGLPFSLRLDIQQLALGMPSPVRRGHVNYLDAYDLSSSPARTRVLSVHLDKDEASSLERGLRSTRRKSASHSPQKAFTTSGAHSLVSLGRLVRFPNLTGEKLSQLPTHLPKAQRGRHGSVTERLKRLSRPNNRLPPGRPPTVGNDSRLPGVNIR